MPHAIIHTFYLSCCLLDVILRQVLDDEPQGESQSTELSRSQRSRTATERGVYWGKYPIDLYFGWYTDALKTLPSYESPENA
jgi:hypothetical protein